MAKGQKRSSREAKKPKQSKAAALPVKPSAMENLIQRITPSFSRGSKSPLKKK